MRPAILLLLALLAAPLAAYDVSTIGQNSVGDNAAWVFQYDLDHGSTAQPIVIDVGITTASNSGLRVRILDVDEKVIAGSQDEALDTQSGPGTANAQLVTRWRTGVHRIVVTVQTIQGGTTVFNGQVEVDVGQVTIVNANQSFKLAEGLFIPFGLYAAFNTAFTSTALYTTNIVVDFGATPQATSFRFEGIGTGVTELRLYDVTHGDTLVSTLYPAPTGALYTYDYVTTSTYSGEVEYRVEVEGNGSAGSIFWATWMPETVSVVRGSGDGADNATPPPDKGRGGDGGGCIATSGHTYEVRACLLVLLVAVCARRGRAARFTR